MRGRRLREIPESEQFWVVAQIALKTKDGTERDRHLERKAKAALTGELAWRGLGVVDRSEIGNGHLNIFCLCPDVNKAVNASRSASAVRIWTSPSSRSQQRHTATPRHSG